MNKKIQLAAMVCASLACALPALAEIKGPVAVEGGRVTGMRSWGDGVQVYKGIPFAAPPTGANRWRPPQPVVGWQGTRAAENFGPACMQRMPPKNTAVYNTGLNGYSEDCLYLNVWTPANAASDKLPVMVWIYGGGGREGSGPEPLYYPDNLAKRGVVVVSFNYRVNVFGWMAHPELTKESPHHASGNYGALDQVAAIKWVKANIAGFGGDPNRITIFGESGGSRSVNWVMASPLAKGSFHRAIGQSHTVFDRMQTLAEAERDGVKFAERLHKKSIAELRALPAQQVLDAYLAGRSGFTAAIVDGHFLPADVATIFGRGEQNDVPLITGGTANEPGGPTRRAPRPKTVAEYTAWMNKTFGKDAQMMLKTYPAASGAALEQAWGALNRDGNYAGHRLWAELQTKSGKSPAYLYMFSVSVPTYGPDHKTVQRIGAPHGSEIAYVFDNLRYADRGYDATDEKIADMAADYWVNFAKTGDPNGEGLPVWPKWTASSERQLDINVTTKAGPVANVDALKVLARGARGE